MGGPAAGGHPGPDAGSRAALARLELVVTRRLDGVLAGDHRGLVPGPGTEPGDAREYLPGDDVRRIDWSVTARTTVPHIRQTVADRELQTWIALDASPGLDVVGTHGGKRELAMAAVATVGFLTAGDGNRTGLVVSGPADPRMYRAAAGADHVRRLLETVAETPTGAPADAPSAAARALTALRGVTARRGLVVLVSDFLGPVDWERELRVLAARHELLAVHLADPLDIALPVVGAARLQDAATGEILEVEVTERLAADYAEAAARHRAQVRDALRRCGAPVLGLRTDRDWVRSVIDFAGIRRRGGLPTGASIENEPVAGGAAGMPGGGRR